MPQTPDSNQLEDIPLAGQAARYPFVEQVLGYIAFEGQQVRIGIELCLCVLFYSLLQSSIPWQQLGFNEQWAGIYSWFVCCSLVIGLDMLFLSRSANIYRRAYLLGLHGEYHKSLTLLQEIGPESSCWIRIPPARYHLHRAELAAQLHNPTLLEEELDRAEAAGAKLNRILYHKLQLQRSLGAIESCSALIEKIGSSYSDSPELLLEQVRTYLHRREEFWEAKRIARRIQSLPDSTHFSGESCHRLAKAYEAVAMLWSGEAEEGLKRLDYEIEYLRRAMLSVDTLRPVFAHLLLERSMYLATHKEPTPAVYDYTLSRALCTYEELNPISQSVRDELMDRFSISLS